MPYQLLGVILLLRSIDTVTVCTTATRPQLSLSTDAQSPLQKRLVPLPGASTPQLLLVSSMRLLLRHPGSPRLIQRGATLRVLVLAIR
mmetsp:Transcript_47949/g.125538  ORF Transcript_47949/g.125538 Transcript_47949/m.125538 type:complete len:88 (-) Transcript_47949:672-935(-)